MRMPPLNHSSRLPDAAPRAEADPSVALGAVRAAESGTIEFRQFLHDAAARDAERRHARRDHAPSVARSAAADAASDSRDLSTSDRLAGCEQRRDRDAEQRSIDSGAAGAEAPIDDSLTPQESSNPEDKTAGSEAHHVPPDAQLRPIAPVEGEVVSNTSQQRVDARGVVPSSQTTALPLESSSTALDPAPQSLRRAMAGLARNPAPTIAHPGPVDQQQVAGQTPQSAVNAAASGTIPPATLTIEQPANRNSLKRSEQGGASSAASASERAVIASTIPRQDELPQTPALARAMQVEASIRLENSTQMAAQPDSAPATATIQSSANPGQPGTAAATGTLPMMSGGDDAHANVSSQVVRGLHALVNQRGGTITMRLEPPELGALRVEMTIARGSVTASFQPASAQAHGLLERGMAALHSALEGHGLTVERLVVHAPLASSSSAAADDRPHDGGMNHRQQHDASHGQSRGRHDQPQQRTFSFAAQDPDDLPIFHLRGSSEALKAAPIDRAVARSTLAPFRGGSR